MKLYHVSYANIGPTVTFYPREPKNRAPNEPEKPLRICVATRVGDCLRMFPWADGQHKAHVYVTEVKNVPRVSRSLPRKYVPDWKKWGREEIWLLNKSGYVFKYVGYVRMFRLHMMIGTAFWYFKRGGEGYPEWEVDPTRYFDPTAAKQCVKDELWRHLETRKFIRETRDKLAHDAAPRLSKYADDVILAEQVMRGEKPHRVPFSKF